LKLREFSKPSITCSNNICTRSQYVKSDDVLKSVAIQLTDFLRRNTTIDWMNQENVKAKIRSGVKKILLDSEFSPDTFEKLVPVIMVQAENNYAEI